MLATSPPVTGVGSAPGGAPRSAPPADVMKPVPSSIVIPEAVAMRLVGHKTRSMPDRYNIVSEGDRREAATRLDTAAGS